MSRFTGLASRGIEVSAEIVEIERRLGQLRFEELRIAAEIRRLEVLEAQVAE